MSQPRSDDAEQPIHLYQPSKEKAPEPVFQFSRLYILNGHPYQWVGERWREEDAAFSPSPTIPDEQHPGIAITARLVDGLTGEIIPSVSFAEFSLAQAVRQTRRSSDCSECH